MGFLIGRASGLLARPRPPLGALSARVVRTAPAPEGRGRGESVCTGRRGGCCRAVGRRLESRVHLCSFMPGRPVLNSDRAGRVAGCSSAAAGRGGRVDAGRVVSH